MARFSVDGVAFGAPADWEDRSILAFSAREREGAAGEQSTAPPNFVVTRETLEPDQTLAQYADAQIEALGEQLARFSIHERVEGTIANKPAVFVRFSWLGQKGPVIQRMTLVAHAGKAFAFTGTAAVTDEPELATAMDRVLASVTFESGGNGK